MNKRNIATTPNNYAVWYEYVNGNNTELVEAIDELEKNHSSFDNHVHTDLYVKYIASNQEAAVNQLSESVRKIIHDFLSKVTNEGSGLHKYARLLSAFSEEVNEAQDIDGLKNLIANLLEETKKREDSTLSMQSSLESMADEMKKTQSGSFSTKCRSNDRLAD